MKYRNANHVLPDEIVKLIQEYINGEYLYIPRKEEEQKKWGEHNGTRDHMKRRNFIIYQKYKKGNSVADLAEEYFLSEKSIRRIITEQKKYNLKVNIET